MGELQCVTVHLDFPCRLCSHASTARQTAVRKPGHRRNSGNSLVLVRQINRDSSVLRWRVSVVV